MTPSSNRPWETYRGRTKPSTVKPLIYIVAIFFLSRVALFFFLGIRFEASSLNWFWQYIDPDLLKNDLIKSVYYLHIQPPFFNLFLGLVLKLSFGHELWAFIFLYKALGLILAISVFFIMKQLGVPDKLNTFLTILFLLSPSYILYENWLFYTHPVATLLCISAIFLNKFLRTNKLKHGVAFFTLLSLIVLTRSLFHFLWFMLFTFILILYQKHNWRKIMLAACIPFLIILCVYVKNLLVFGSFTTSTWMGMSLSKMTTFSLSETKRRSLHAEGRISHLSLVPPFSGLEKYQVNLPPKTNIPVLDQELKSTGYPNLNHIAFIGISRQYLKDAVRVLVSYPETYLKSLVNASFIYFIPYRQHRCPAFDINIKRMRYLNTLYDIAFYGRFIYYKSDPTLKRVAPLRHYIRTFLSTGLFLQVYFFVSLFYGLYLLQKSLWQSPVDRCFGVTILFLLTNVVYVAIVGNALEVGDNCRFRFLTDPFTLVIMGLFFSRKHRDVARGT